MDSRHSDSLKTLPFVIYPSLSYVPESEEFQKYTQDMYQLLSQLIPEKEFFEDANDLLTWINEKLPLVKWNEIHSTPDCLKVYLLCRSSREISSEEVICNVLINELSLKKNIRLLSLQHLDFLIPEIKGELLFVAEAKFLIENNQQYQQVKKILPSLEKKIKLAVSSSKQAFSILNTRPYNHDLKVSLIYEKILKKIKQYPHLFKEDLFDEMSRFLALSDDEFRHQRSAYHLSQIICSQYLVKRKLAKALCFDAEKRHLFVHLLRSRLCFTFGKKTVVGLMIGLNLQDLQEFFGEKHIIRAVQKIIPSAHSVKGSLYVHKKQEELTQVIYLEIEKKDGDSFSSQELQILKKKVPNELKGGIEKLVSSVFMVRNEEETMKNIVVLGKELKVSSDLPQITIRFEEQTSTELIFSVVLVRPIKADFSNQISRLPNNGYFIIERTQIMGILDNQYLKEACVLLFHIPKEPEFFRSDFSVNLHPARQKVITIITELVGEVRDYTGGMLSEQEKQFLAFQQLFPQIAFDEVKLLEDFFYSITPIEAQCILRVTSLQFLFSEFLSALGAAIENKSSYFLKVREKEGQIYVVLKADPSIKLIIQRALEERLFPSGSFISSFVIYQESIYLNFIYLAHDKTQQHVFITTIQDAIRLWQSNLQSQKTLRLSAHDLRDNLDPRLGGGDREFSAILRLLYDGLTRIDKNGKPQLSSAQTVEISKDKKRYLFTLRDCTWSDGSKLIAYDFEYTWKRILHPSFKSPFSSLLYPIKNAKAVKEGLLSIDDLGVKSLSEKRLLIELESPTPYFLESVANAFYSPVNHRVDQLHPNWTSQIGENYVCNGPFILKKRSSKQYELEKNHSYWDASSVQLDQVVIHKTDPYDALTMFKAGKIDWLGRPLRPWEPFFSKTYSEPCHPAASMVHWCVFNVEAFPLNHIKIRQALTAAICREEIIQKLAMELIPARSILPLEHSQSNDNSNYAENKMQARLLFEEALKELGMKKENFPVLTLICLKGSIRENTALMIKKQWEECLDIYCRIELYDWHTLFDKMTKGDYQIGGMTWKSLFNDPIYTLNAFRYQNDLINFAKWKNNQYQELLAAADIEEDEGQRRMYFAQTEAILARELPLIPLYYEFENFTKNDNLEISLNSSQIDFKWVSIKKTFNNGDVHVN